MDLTRPFRELVDRKLWPLALVLVLALAAVPLLLSRSAESAAGPAAPIVANADDDADPVVDATDPATLDAAREVLGKEKDPFRAARVIRAAAKKAKRAEKAGAAQSAGGSGTTGGGSGTTGGGSGTTGGGSGTTGGTSGGQGATSSPAPAGPAPTATPVATPTPDLVFPLQSLEVRFGTVEEPDHADRTLTRLSGLPKGATPALLYLGLLKDRKTAVFLVDDRVSVLGDGACRPTPDTCETLRMRKGDIEFVGTPDGGQYQVEVLKVHTRETRSASVARASRTRTARGGKRWLRKMGGKGVGLRYDAADGTLTKK